MGAECGDHCNANKDGRRCQGIYTDRKNHMYIISGYFING